jgi:bisphosphoglycerate-dependent phosphoglycerate mutase
MMMWFSDASSFHFAGWVDVDVSAKGAEEAVNAGRWNGRACLEQHVFGS